MGFFRRTGIISSDAVSKLDPFRRMVEEKVKNTTGDSFGPNEDYEAQFNNSDNDGHGGNVDSKETSSSEVNNTGEDKKSSDVNSKEGNDKSVDHGAENNKNTDDVKGNDASEKNVNDSKGSSNSGNSSSKTEGGSAGVNAGTSNGSSSDNSGTKASENDFSGGKSTSSEATGTSSGDNNSKGNSGSFGQGGKSNSSSENSGDKGTKSKGKAASSGTKGKRENEGSSKIKYIDANGNEAEISLSDYRDSLRKYGLSDEDIDRVFYDGISLQDLITEIMNDEDSSRRRHLYDSQFFFQMKASYDNVDASQIDKNNSMIDELQSKKAKLEAQAANLRKNTGKDTYQGKVYSADEAKAIADLEKQIEDLENQINDLECNSKQIELGDYYKQLLSDVNSIDDLEAKVKSLQEELDGLLSRKSALGSRIDSHKNVGGITIQTASGTQYDTSSLSGLYYDQLELGNFQQEHNDRIDELKKAISELNTIIETIEMETFERVELLDPYEAKEDFLDKCGFEKTNENLANDLYFKYNRSSDNVHRDFSATVSKEDEAKILYYMLNGGIDFRDNDLGSLMVNSDDKILEHYARWLTEGMDEGIITDEEIKVFNYIYNTEGVDSALKYLDDLEPIIDQRYLMIKSAHDQSFADEHPVLASLGSVLVTPFEGMSAMAASFHAKTTDDKLLRTDVYSMGDVWRARVSQNILESSGEEAAFIYNTVMSMADSGELIIFGTVFPGAPAFFSALLMGSRAYVSTINDALDRGLSDDEAIMLAASSAIVETAMESYSLGHLLNLEEHLGAGTMKLVQETINKTDDKFTAELVYCLAGAVSQGFAEGEEEFATEILNYCFDEVISGDLSNFSLTIQNYMDQGYSELDAKNMAMNDFKEQLEQAFLGGFASGVCFGAFGSVKNTHDISKGIAQTIQNEYNVSEAQALGIGLELQRLAQNNGGVIQVDSPSESSRVQFNGAPIDQTNSVQGTQVSESSRVHFNGAPIDQTNSVQGTQVSESIIDDTHSINDQSATSTESVSVQNENTIKIQELQENIKRLEAQRANLWALGENNATDEDMAKINEIGNEIDKLSTDINRINAEETFAKYAAEGIGDFDITHLGRAFSSDRLFTGILYKESALRDIVFLKPFADFYEEAMSNGYDIDDNIMSKMESLRDLYNKRSGNFEKVKTAIQATIDNWRTTDEVGIGQIQSYLDSNDLTYIPELYDARDIIAGMTKEEIELALRDYSYYKEQQRIANFKTMELLFDTMMSKYDLSVQETIEQVLKYLKTGNPNYITNDNSVRTTIIEMSLEDFTRAFDDYVDKHVMADTPEAMAIFDSIYNAAMEENKRFDAKKVCEEFKTVVIDGNVNTGKISRRLRIMGLTGQEAYGFSLNSDYYERGKILLQKIVSKFGMYEEMQPFLKKVIEIKKIHPQFAVISPLNFYTSYEYVGAVYLGSNSFAWSDVGTLAHEIGHAIHEYEDGFSVPGEWNNIMRDILRQHDYSAKVRSFAASCNRDYNSLYNRALEEVSINYGAAQPTLESIYLTQKYKDEVNYEYESLMQKSNGDLADYMRSLNISDDTVAAFINQLSDNSFIRRLLGMGANNRDQVIRTIAEFTYKAHIQAVVRSRAEGYQRNVPYNTTALCDIIAAISFGRRANNMVLLPDGSEVNLQFAHSYDEYYANDRNRIFMEIVANFIQLKVSGYTGDLSTLRNIIGDNAYNFLESYYDKLMAPSTGNAINSSNVVFGPTSISTISSSANESLIDSNIDLNNYDSLKGAIDSINSLTDFGNYNSLEEYKRAFVRELVDSGRILEIKNGQCIFALVTDPVMAEELVGTEKLNNMIIKNILNPLLFNDISNVICSLSDEKFNELFSSEAMRSFVQNLSDEDFEKITKYLLDKNMKALQNDVFVDRLLQLDNSSLLDVLINCKRSYDKDYFYTFYDSIGEDSSYVRLMEELSERFFEPEFYFANVNNINNLADRLYSSSIYKLENEFFKNFISSFISKHDEVKKSVYSKLSDLAGNVINYENGSLRVNDSILNGSKYYILSYDIDGKTITTDYYGFSLFSPPSDMVEAAYRGTLSNISIVANDFKNKLEITPEMGLSKGLNEIVVMVDGVEQRIIGQSLYGSSINIANYFSPNSNVEVKTVIPLNDYNHSDLNANQLYEVLFETENGLIKKYLLADSTGSLDLNSIIYHESILGIKDVQVNEMSLNEAVSNLVSIDSNSAFSDIFSATKYGGNQGDVYNYLKSLLDGEELSTVEREKATILNNLINKYFGDLSDIDKVKLAYHYANGGCFYMAFANIFATYMGSLENGASIFKNLFGYDLYIEDGSLKQYNLEAIAFEMYLNHFSKNYDSISSILDSGDAGVSLASFDSRVKSLFDEKGIEIDRNAVLRINTPGDVNNMLTTIVEDLLKNPNGFHIISAKDFSLESLISDNRAVNDAALAGANASNGNYEHVGGHAMTLVDVDVDGSLIVSSWGGKYRLPLSSVIENVNNGSYCRVTNIGFKLPENVIISSKGGE